MQKEAYIRLFGPSPTATFSNAGLAAGTDRLQVRVRNLGSSRPFDARASITIVHGGRRRRQDFVVYTSAAGRGVLWIVQSVGDVGP